MFSVQGFHDVVCPTTVPLFGQWIHELLQMTTKSVGLCLLSHRSFCHLFEQQCSSQGFLALEWRNEGSLSPTYTCPNLMYCWVSYCFISSFPTKRQLVIEVSALNNREASDLRLLMPIADKSWDWMRWWGIPSHPCSWQVLFIVVRGRQKWRRVPVLSWQVFLNMITKRKHLFSMKIVSIHSYQSRWVFSPSFWYIIQRGLLLA